MELSAAQLTAFERGGFLRFDNLFGPGEIALLKTELTRTSSVESDANRLDEPVLSS